MTHSTLSPISGQRRSKQERKEKFPLTARRGDGRWCKKIRGVMHYFTGTADEALTEWMRVKDDLLAGRQPRAKVEGVTVAELCNQFLAAKGQQKDAGELTKRSWLSYFAAATRLTAAFGRNRVASDVTIPEWQALRASIAKTRGPIAIGNEVQRVRTIYKWGYESGLLSVPMRFGPDFRKPSNKVLRLAKAENGEKLFSAGELVKLLDSADVHLIAMIYLGLNCGYGNSDCGTLPIARIDLDGGWSTYHRPGGMTAAQERRLDLPLDFLGQGSFTAELYLDDPGGGPTSPTRRTLSLTTADTLRVVIPRAGGFAARRTRTRT